MKILNVEQIRATDAYTIQNEPIESHDLMERAANAFVNCFVKKYVSTRSVHIFCGVGNNGGDGLCIGRLLYLRGYKVQVYVVRFSPKASSDFLLNEQRCHKITNIRVHEIITETNFNNFNQQDLIIDALFGSGLSRPITGFTAHLIQQLNNSGCPIIAVDMPSGLYADKATPKDATVIQAQHTICFELPKLAFMFPQNYPYVGTWQAPSIGLHTAFMNRQNTAFYYFSEILAQSLLAQYPKNKFAHKGNKGHTLVIGGKYGCIGAIVLTAQATLKAGAGLVTAYIPRCGYEIMQTSAKEVMCLCDTNQKHITTFFPSKAQLTKYQSIAIGPGLGQAEATQKALLQLLENSTIPLVIDADALNIIAYHNWLHKIPTNSILTPHPKEFERLAGKSDDEFERLEKLRSIAKKYQVIVVLKGAHTAVALPNGAVYFNSTGNPAMATAGSGDVLTGIIAAHVSQGYSAEDSALLGVYQHGLAGDNAAATKGQIVAGDMVLFYR